MIVYRNDITISPDQFVDLLKRSTLDQRRPINDPERIKKMLIYGNVLITAWDEDLLIGVARGLSDFAFCCYLSDLAVDEAYQKKGIGGRLIAETKNYIGEDAKLILLAAPAAENYYPKIGMKRFEHCFILPDKK